ncbi:MAG: phosphate acyltransferase, partial [Desulfatiglandales bacterium]
IASSHLNVRIRLFGSKEGILRVSRNRNLEELAVTIVESPEVISMDDPPTLSIRERRDSSIYRLCQALKEGEVQAMVGAGNTGAMVAGSVMILGKLKGIRRPGLLGILPGLKGPLGIIDVGACVDSRPLDLMSFALMGDLFWKSYRGNPNPRIGLLNIGEEKNKGSRVAKEVYSLLERAKLNFVGNVEGNEILLNKADVIITDGFVGNIVLKALEGMGEIISLREGGIGGDLLFDGPLSWEEYGGAVLLGVDGVVVICHGRSTSKAIFRAISFAKELVEKALIDSLKDGLRISK